MLLQKTFTEDVLTGVHKKNTGQLPQYYIENYHEGIVSKQMFREVQAEIARRNSKSAANQRKHRRGRYNSKYALSERLVCGNCGSPYKRVTWNIHGRKQIVWRCVNRIEYGTKFCGSSPSVPEEKLHRAILKAVQDLYYNAMSGKVKADVKRKPTRNARQYADRIARTATERADSTEPPRTLTPTAKKRKRPAPADQSNRETHHIKGKPIIAWFAPQSKGVYHEQYRNFVPR